VWENPNRLLDPAKFSVQSNVMTPQKPLKNPNFPGRRGKLTPEQRKKLLERLKAGEKPGPLSIEYQISRQAVCQLRDYHFNPDATRRKGVLRSRLLPEERNNVIHLLRTTYPRDHGVENEGYGHPDVWNYERLTALTKKLYAKKMFMYAARECIQEARPDPRFDPDAKPQPPEPFDIRHLDPELANDKEYVNYCLSPISQQIRQKEYEWALREWEEREARKAKRVLPEAPKRKRGRPRKTPLPASSNGDDDGGLPYDGTAPLPGTKNGLTYLPPAPGERVGKHAKSKGARSSKPKRRKKR